MSKDKKEKRKKIDKDDIQNYKDEYRLITDHIFEEGRQQLSRNKFFLGIILALFTAFGFFVKEIIVDKEGPSYGNFQYLLFLLPIVGVFISFFWVKLIRKVEGHLRLRVIRQNILEESIGYYIYLANKDFQPKWHQKTASWAIFSFMGYMFAVIWLIMFSMLLEFFLPLSFCCAAFLSLFLVPLYLLIDLILIKFSYKQLVK